MTPQEERALRALLAAHGARYPRMEACDAVKLLYQSEHGGGHLIADPESSLARLREEWARTAPRADVPLCEDIGGGMVRIALAAVREEQYPLDALNRDFVRSAALHRGDRAAFLRKLALLRRVACEGGLPFSADALKDYLAGYLAAGCPPASHSAAYRAAYAPAYRVVLRAACLPLLLMQAEELAARQGCVLVALDGRCASGKSTLADRLHRAHGWPVVHMDDFFLRPAQRTPARYAQPGGNIDHERFLEEVLAPLRAGREALYRPFDCGTMTLGEPVRLAPAGVVLVEGSYSCHPALWDGYDLHAFLTVGPEEQRRRIRARNGAAGEARFAEQWIPLEERYFAAFDLPARCEYFLEL